MDTDSTQLAMKDARSHHHVENSVNDFFDECHKPGNSLTKPDNIYPRPSVDAFQPGSPGDLLANHAQAKRIKYQDTLDGAHNLRSVAALLTRSYYLVSPILPENSEIADEFLFLQRSIIDACLQDADKIERSVVDNIIKQLGLPTHIRAQVNRDKETRQICDEGLTNALQEFYNQKQLADLHRRPQYTSYRGNGQGGRNRGRGRGFTFGQSTRNQYQNRSNSSSRYGAPQKD